MGFKELVEEAIKLLDVKSDYSESKNVYSLSIEFEDGSQVIHVYQDIFENEDEGISKKIIVCESLVGKFDSSKDIKLISQANNDMFFSKAYVSDDKILVESCSFMENLTALNLSVIITEVAECASTLKSELE